MRNKRWATLAGIVVAVTLLTSTPLTMAQEGQPPVQPADVESQANRVLWNQFDSVDGGSTVLSYVLSPEWAVAADDFVVSETQPVTYTAWILSQVVVRAFVDQHWPGTERASVCFYGDASGAPMAAASMCSTGLLAAESPDDTAQSRVLTYTLSASPLFFTGSRNWFSVQMTGMTSGGAWYWRSRSDATPYAGTKAFAFSRSAGMYPSDFSTACEGRWQVQTSSSKCNLNDPRWPAGHDMSFKLIGSTFDGVLSPKVYMPLLRR